MFPIINNFSRLWLVLKDEQVFKTYGLEGRIRVHFDGLTCFEGEIWLSKDIKYLDFLDKMNKRATNE